MTAVSVALPGDALNQNLVQIRVSTINAAGNDEWVGVDDIVIGTPAPTLPAWVTGAATWDGTTLNVTGTATIVANPATASPPASPLVTASGAAAQLLIAPADGRVATIGGLTLAADADATIVTLGGSRTAANSRVLRIAGAVSIDSAGGSKLDITDNNLIIDYNPPTTPSPLAALSGLIKLGRGTGNWQGTGGITSSTAADPGLNGGTAVGINDNAERSVATQITTFADQTIDVSTVIIKYTYQSRGFERCGEHQRLVHLQRKLQRGRAVQGLVFRRRGLQRCEQHQRRVPVQREIQRDAAASVNKPSVVSHERSTQKPRDFPVPGLLFFCD